MKRVLIISISLLLAVVLVAATAGCNDKAKAQEYMKKGDELSTQSYSLSAFTKEMNSADFTSLLTELGLDLAAATAGDWESSASEVTSEIDRLISDANNAQDEYEKILALDGVDDYQQYAELKIKALENYIPVLESLQSLINQMGKALSQGKSLSDTANAWYKDNKSIQTELLKTVTYWAEAELLKKQKKLED
ncbi:MAG: hypothetical protein JW738_05755 [Actinobacteria bacterium]|nr:hypothetical protein [Actinomycetota bacterium]